MSAGLLRDDPWRRLAWELPAALVLLLVSLAGFLHLLAEPGTLPTPAPPAPMEVDLVELPSPTPAAVPPAPEPPPPPMAQPEPPPPLPLPEVSEDEPPPPPPEPAAAAQPEAPPPKPRPPPPRARPPAPPQTAAVPSAATAAPPTTSTATAPSGNMGARALFKPMPEIPEALRHHALDLTALARFRVAASGAAEVELVEPTPDPTLNAALLETLKRWRFFPAMENGKAVASTIDIRIPITVR